MAYSSITPRVYPLKFAEGLDWIAEIPCVLNDEGDLAPFDGMTAKAQVRTHPNSGTVVATFSSYELTLYLTEGTLKLQHYREQHPDVSANDYWWDCVLTNDLGEEIPLILPSKFEVYKNVTEP